MGIYRPPDLPWLPPPLSSTGAKTLLGAALAPRPDLGWLSALAAAPPPPSNYPNALSAFGGLAPTAVPALVWQWRYVRQRFSELVENLKITASQLEDGNCPPSAPMRQIGRVEDGSD